MDILTGYPVPSVAPGQRPALASMIAEVLRLDCAPVVFVLSTPAVEAICQKNALSFVDLLNAHSNFENINVPVRTAGEQPYRLQDFRLRVFAAKDIAQPSSEAAEEHLTQLVTNAGEAAASELQGDPGDIRALLSMANRESLSSWFQVYSREFWRALWFSDHEALDHPVACILAATSGDGDLVSTFQELYGDLNLPALFREGIADPAIHQHYVLLHDLHSGPLESADAQLLQMEKTFGPPNCHILAVNSLKEPNQSRPDIWTIHRRQPIVKTNAEPNLMDAGENHVGQYLSDGDVLKMAEFMKEVVVQRIIPLMERKVRAHNHQVVANRKGLRNQIKNLWFRKGKEEETPTGGYTYKSMESQIRVLADYSIMLRDYELALSSYRLLASDYRSDKAWRHFAGAQEMIGICLFLLDQSRRETEQCMESAYTYYQRAGPTSGRYATRTALWLVGVYKARGQFREAASTLMRASLEETNLRAGVLLEQAAYCFLRAEPMMLRKYGFHMVLAGNRYNLSAQRKHAIRAYSYVSGVYQGKGWNYISDHCNFTLGRLSAFLGSYEAAVKFFMRLLACGHQSTAMQTTFLREFLYVLQSVEDSDGKGPLDLGLPEVNVEQVHVHFEDQRTWATPSARVLPEALWTSLEEGVVPPVAAMVVPTWLDAPKAKSGGSEPIPTNTCIAGEDIVVDVEFYNPLHITLEVTGVRLLCEYNEGNASAPTTSTATGGLQRTISSPAMTHEEASTLKAVREAGIEHSQSIAVGLSDLPPGDLVHLSDASIASEGPDPVGRSQVAAGESAEEDAPRRTIVVQEEACTLPATERVVMQLKVKPLEKGMLRVVGVEWTISSEGRQARGRKDFSIKPMPRRKGKGAGGPRGIHPPHLRLNFRVLESMPRLELQLHGLPQRTLQGELHRLTLELSNSSAVNLKDLKLKSSHPGMIVVGQPGELDLELPRCLEAVEGTEAPAADAEAVAEHGSAQHGYVFSFPQGTELEGGSTLLWPLWLHARDPGSTKLNLVLYYEPDSPAGAMKFRTLRATYSLQVEASLKVGIHIGASPSSLSRHVMRVDVANQHAADNFWLRQVSCSGSTWQMSSLSPAPIGGQEDVQAAYMSASVAPPQLLPPGQMISLFFQLQTQEAASCLSGDETDQLWGSNSPPRSQWGTNIRLGDPESPSEALIDISSGPFHRFHDRERQLQTPPQMHRGHVQLAEGPDTAPVDVVLIWESQSARGVADDPAAATLSSTRVGSHHVCHCRVSSWAPIRWALLGPSCLVHNFLAQPVCDLPLCLRLRNCSTHQAAIHVKTLDPGRSSTTNAAPGGTTSANEVAGWYHPRAALTGPAEGATAASGNLPQGAADTAEEQQCGTTPVGPFIWTGTTSRTIGLLAPGESTQIALQAAVLAPGVYDLSSLSIAWELTEMPTLVQEEKEGFKGKSRSRALRDVESGGHVVQATTGTGAGHTFLTLVLPSGEE